MKRKLIFLICGLICSFNILATQAQQTELIHAETALKKQVKAIIENGDTIALYELPTVWVYPPMKFKNKRAEKFYWRTVRDVKKTLPLSKYIKEVIIATNDTLMKLPTKRERDKYMRGFEKRIYKQEYGRMSKLTLRQGMLLIRLVDRECDATGYDLIKAYRGSFTAGFYQMFAKMFGASLKTEYGSHEDDATIERIINLVESGQL
ncbi:MAG: DUF4294 domain-containing protein [Paludibacteraceae bacterium]|nr:DUF4294 domain-containing protein [Paludibacteraceae bacterium]